MKAVTIVSFGGVEGLEIRNVPDPPPPTADRVRVRVRAAGLNRADILQRLGRYPAPSGYSRDIPGLEFAGEVESLVAARRQSSLTLPKIISLPFQQISIGPKLPQFPKSL